VQNTATIGSLAPHLKQNLIRSEAVVATESLVAELLEKEQRFAEKADSNYALEAVLN